MTQKSETIKVPSVKVSQNMSVPLGAGLVVQPLPDTRRPCSIASTSSVSFPPYHPSTLRHYHYSQSPTPSVPNIRLSPNELHRTMPRTVLGASVGACNIPIHERNTLSRQSSVQLPGGDGGNHPNNQVINAVTALSHGTTLQKAKRMYI